ncbi:MAG TPA: adenosylcobinamide-GDP ribazoletransferase [Streptosporangiaceae bacterium]|nr:adenosylcobinamide-GDP ribazoletransferase [Streptosporangiaceae bacterium]
MGWNGLRLSVTLLTVFALRGGATARPDRATAGAAMAWAPGVGLLLGVIAAAVLLVADHPLGAGPLTAAALALASLALLSRGLHLDGLADLADGLGSGQPEAAALDIMRRSDIGPFGAVTLILSLLIQFAALGHAESAGPGRGPAALIAAVVTGRLALTWGCRRGVPAARPDGLGALVAGTVRPAIAAAAALAATAAGVAAVLISAEVTSEPLGWTLPLAVVAGLAATLVLERHAVRRLGGITGDVLGALAEVATTVTLVVAAMGPRALAAEAAAEPLGHGLRRAVDRALPVQALQERRVRPVEELQVRAAGQAQVQRVALGAGRRSVDRAVEALKAHLRVAAQGQRQPVGQFADEIVVQFSG